jgi:hypothetical protein
MTNELSESVRLLEFAARLRNAAADADRTPGVSRELPALLRRLAGEREAAAAVLSPGA